MNVLSRGPLSRACYRKGMSTAYATQMAEMPSWVVFRNVISMLCILIPL